MEFKYIQKSEDLFKGKLYLKDREVSIIEFQYRIFDLVKAKDTPLMERLQFIKIISSNLEEFIAIRLPDIEGDKKESIICLIEELYFKMGKELSKLNKSNDIYLDDAEKKDIYKVIKNRNFRFIYAGESEKEVIDEIQRVSDMKDTTKEFSVLFSGKGDIELENCCDIIHVPRNILLIKYYIDAYKEIFTDDKYYYPKEIDTVVDRDYYTELKYHDILIHNPYESYDNVVNFIDQMCTNENITCVFISLYRTSEHSVIVEKLIKAKELGKTVCVYVEPTARDNEKSNLDNIKRLTEAGVHVSCNYFNYKVHGKLFCAIDKDYHVYAHIGTGNYNEVTGKQYTDIHLLTTDESITDEILSIFLSIFKKKIYTTTKSKLPIYTSPINFRGKINHLIDDEIRKGRYGKIIIKCNNLCDCSIIDKLYTAADRGVQIYIICRTGCAIITHDNIHIRSKVGRYLEHDRFYIFGDKIYISSADLLLRNISKRVEILCEIKDEFNKSKIRRIFRNLWNSKNIHELTEDAKWELI